MWSLAPNESPRVKASRDIVPACDLSINEASDVTTSPLHQSLTASR